MKKSPRLFYGYILVAVAVVIQLVSGGTYNSFGVFFNALLQDFDWSRATLSGAASLAQLMIGVGSIFFGRLNDRFGPRILIAVGGLLAGLGYFLISTMHSVWQFYLFYGVVAGIGLSGMDIILLSTTARWFVKRRGMMSGIVKMGTGIGILIMPILLNFLISNFDWRTACVITGIIMAAFLILGALFLFKDPSQKGQLPDNQEPVHKHAARTDTQGLSLGQALHTRRFILLCLAYFSVFFCTCIIVIHVAPFSLDLGFSSTTSALMLSVIGAASITGRLVIGTIGDRIGSRYAVLACFTIFIFVFIWVQFTHQLWQLILFAVIYGIAHGGFFALVSPAVAEAFGLRSHGLIFGCVIFIGSVGGALGPLLAGYIFDVSGSYHLTFLLLLTFSVIGFAAIFASGLSRKKAAVFVPTPGK